MTNHQALLCIGNIRAARDKRKYKEPGLPLYDAVDHALDDSYLMGLMAGMALATGHEPNSQGIRDTIDYLLEVSGEPGL